MHEAWRFHDEICGVRISLLFDHPSIKPRPADATARANTSSPPFMLEQRRCFLSSALSLTMAPPQELNINDLDDLEAVPAHPRRYLKSILTLPSRVIRERLSGRFLAWYEEQLVRRECHSLYPPTHRVDRLY